MTERQAASLKSTDRVVIKTAEGRMTGVVTDIGNYVVKIRWANDQVGTFHHREMSSINRA